MLRRYLLWPFSLLYGLAVVTRNKLYDWGIFPSIEFDIPIISVGNLSTGGTGKTPQIEYLVESLKPNYKVATLSRGYGGSNKSFTIVNENSKATEIGDEPLQIKLKHPDITVSINPDRVDGINSLKQEVSPDVILLDDAFQHRKVKAGLSILITPYSSPFYNDALLPAGNLREPISGKDRADIIIVSKCPSDINTVEMQEVKSKLKPSSMQQVFFSGIQYGEPLLLNRDTTMEIASNTSVVLVTGIANPTSLLDYVSTHFDIKEHIKYPDHHNFSQNNVNLIRQKISIIAGAQKAIITTEKDAARLLGHDLAGLPVFYIPIQTRFLGDGEEKRFNNLIINYVEGNKGNR